MERMNRCPNCGHEWKDEGRRKGGSRRWKGTRKTDRSAAMKAVRAAGIQRKSNSPREAGSAPAPSLHADVWPDKEGA